MMKAAASLFSKKKASIGPMAGGATSQHGSHLEVQEIDDGTSTVMNMSVRMPSRTIIKVRSIN